MFRIRFRVHIPVDVCSRTVLASILLPIILLAVFCVNQVRATSPQAPSAPNAPFGMRQFYLTKFSVRGNQTLTACEAGYHFASIWELADPSSLNYNASLGATGQDSGAGPPTRIGVTLFGPARGWVRTGYGFSVSDTVGQANCGNWLSDYSLYWGTAANLPTNWTAGLEDIGLWNVEVRTCNTLLRVWCVQDDSVLRIYLPLILR